MVSLYISSILTCFALILQEFDEKLSPDKKGASAGASGSAASTPSAPELPHPGEVTARGINTECVICLEETVETSFTKMSGQ